MKLQRFQQCQICLNDYFKKLEFLMLRVGIDEYNEENVARFVNGLRRDIQDLVELYDYSIIEFFYTLS